IKWLAGILSPALHATGVLTIGGETEIPARGLISYQPQSDALFPWLTIAENVCLGLEISGLTRAQAWTKARTLFEPFGLAGSENLFPKELSGGMRQRAAFLRTIVQDSRFILLDEPFSALDAVTKLRMENWLMARLEADPRGVLMVTHDLHEATSIADQILVMASEPGRIIADIPVDIPKQRRDETTLAGLRNHLKSLLLEDNL